MTAATIAFLVLVAALGYMLYASVKRKEESAADSLPPTEAFTTTAAPVADLVEPDKAPEGPVQSNAPLNVIRGESGLLSDGASRLGLAPGWYPDPDGSHETYFDGARWGETRERVSEVTPDESDPTV